MYPQIVVTQLQLRYALIDLGLYDQWDNNYMNLADTYGKVYWEHSPTLASDSEHFNDDNTTLTEAQRYSAFLLAQGK